MDETEKGRYVPLEVDIADGLKQAIRSHLPKPTADHIINEAEYRARQRRDEVAEPVRSDEVYGAAVEAYERTRKGKWLWRTLTAGEQQEWLDIATPIVRAVLEAQRGL